MDPLLNLVRRNSSLRLGVFFQSGGQPTAEPMVEIVLHFSRSRIHRTGRIIHIQPNLFPFVLSLSDLFSHQSRRLLIECMLSHVNHEHRSDIDAWTDRISSYAFHAANAMVLGGYGGILIVVDLNIFTAAQQYWPSVSDYAPMVHGNSGELLMDEVLRRSVEEARANGNFGAVRASKSSIKALETKTYQGDEKDGSTCLICLDDFLDGVELIIMPCSHNFHRSCATKWLETSHFCPLCRYPMPMVDEEDATA